MNVLQQAQQNRRFWFYIVFTAVCMLISFWGGYRLGREVERDVQSCVFRVSWYQLLVSSFEFRATSWKYFEK